MEENAELYIPEQLPPPPPSIWINIWYRAISEPYALTYRDIARRTDLKTAYLWWALLYLVPGALMLVLYAFGMLVSTGLDQILGVGLGLIGLVVVYVLSTVGAIAFYSVMTALSNVIAKTFGGQGDFRRLMFCVTAYTIPAAIVQWILGFLLMIPCINILVMLFAIVFMFYPLVLNVVAIKAIHQIETWQAIVSSVAVYVLWIIILVCLMVVMIMIEYSMAGNILSTVIAGLEAVPAY